MYSVSMADMAKTPEEVKEDSEPMAPVSVNRYPYGLCLSLDQDDLEKLSMPLDAEVGDMIHVMAFARVTSVSKQELADGKCNCRVELQITHLALEDEDQEMDGAEAAA